MSRGKYIATVAILMITAFTASSFVVVGGLPDFDYSIDEKDDGTVTVTASDTSFGLFEGVTWDVRDYSGNKLLMNEDGTETWHKVIYPFMIGVKAYEDEWRNHTTVLSSSPTSTSDSITWGPQDDQPNVYRVTMSARSLAGVERKVTKDIVLEGEREHTIVFKSDPELKAPDCTVTYSVHTSDFIRYRNENINRMPGDSVNAALVSRYVNGTSNVGGTIDAIIEQLKEKIPDGSSEEYSVNIVMAFVQNLQYISDIRSMGTDEYWNFPIETLFIGGGDCEDVAMLTMALLRAFFADGEDTISTMLLISWGRGHAMAAVAMTTGPIAVPGNPGHFYMDVNDASNTRKYYTCETTSPGWKVGQAGLNEIGITGPDHTIVV